MKILKKCGNSTISRKQNPFKICDQLSPSKDQSGCLSLSEYLSKYILDVLKSLMVTGWMAFMIKSFCCALVMSVPTM